MNDISPLSIVAPSDITQAVREAAMLADVSLSMWEANKNDRNLMEDVKRQHKARGDVGKVIKYLLSGADGPLKATQNAFKAVPRRHRELTLPWVSNPNATRVEGPRLLPHLLWQRYNDELSALRNDAFAQLDEFVAEYPDLVIKAKSNLGTMVDDTSYPTPEEMRAKWDVYFDFFPLPKGDDFGGLPDITLERLNK